MKNNQKGFVNIILIGIIVLLIVLVGWIWFKNSGYQSLNYYIFHKGMPPEYCDPGPCGATKPLVATTTDEIANWKTYKNTQYGFSFNYPNDWAVPFEKNPHDGLGSIELGCPKEDVLDTEACPLSIDIWQSGSYEISMFDSPKAEVKTFTVNGVQIKEFKPYKEPGSDGPIGYYEIANISGDNITVQFTDSMGDYESNGIFDHILSTFKFTK
jgi:hypothetical protein